VPAATANQEATMTTVSMERPRPGVAVLTLNRPDRLNALSFGLVADLHAALDELNDDNTCRVVVLTGAGRGFCSGLDLKEYGGSTRSRGLRGPHAGMRSQEHIAELIPHLRGLPQPVIAAINGPAYGGGFAITLACDIRIASESARLCSQFIKLGLSGCDIGISYLLPRLIGAARAHELILTARDIDAREAERIGLVSRVVADDALLATALDIADTICGYTPFGVFMTKEAMWANLDAPSVEAAIHLENRNQILAGQTGDIEEAVAAFREKRAPVWTSS
jgi:enoyl-CoA hydratase/carnithine racemase